METYNILNRNSLAFAFLLSFNVDYNMEYFCKLLCENKLLVEDYSICCNVSGLAINFYDYKVATCCSNSSLFSALLLTLLR